MKRLFHFCSSFFFILPSLFFFSRCTPQETSHKHKKETLFIYQVDNVDSIFHLNGLKYRLRARLEDDSIKYSDSIFIPGFGRYIQRRDTLSVKKYPHGLTIIITCDTTKDTTLIKADYARFQNTGEGVFEFRGNVQMTSLKYALFTEQLKWDLWKKEYVSEKDVRIIDSGTELTGTGFESNENFSRFQIQNMKGTMPVK